MSAVVLLDSEPLGLLSNPNLSARVRRCRQWLDDLLATGRRVLIPEITDYEVRRELLRANLALSITFLDLLAQRAEYLPLTTAAMRKAAELWALARQQGRPTAADPALDGDVILAAQALTLGAPQGVVATSNAIHLARYVPAERWQNITPRLRR
jgi:predicted nucleic acid-binding protein